MILKFILLRRTKAELQNMGEMEALPEKNTEIVRVKLNDDEINVYQILLAFSKTLLQQFRADRDGIHKFNDIQNQSRKSCLRKALKIFKAAGSLTASHIFLIILRLRQICIHPNLIDAVSMTLYNSK